MKPNLISFRSVFICVHIFSPLMCYVYIYIFIDNFCFGGLMIYKMVIAIIIIGVLFELIENLFPANNMTTIIKMATRIIMIFVVCKMLSNIL